MAASFVRTRSSKLNVPFNAPSGRPNGKTNLKRKCYVLNTKIR